MLCVMLRCVLSCVLSTRGFAQIIIFFIKSNNFSRKRGVVNVKLVVLYTHAFPLSLSPINASITESDETVDGGKDGYKDWFKKRSWTLLLFFFRLFAIFQDVCT